MSDRQLGGIAAGSTPEQFATEVRRRARDLLADGGVARFEQQRRAVRFRSWTCRDTGMVRVSGAFDPETGARLLNRVQHQLDTMFHDQLPDTCPTDPLERQDHLGGLAVLALTQPAGTGTCSGRRGRGVTELVVTIDVHTLESGAHPGSPGSRVDTGWEMLELPIETIRRLGCIADVIPILRRDGVVIDVGRTQRLATKTQRRALRAMYSTCAIPGCPVRFDLCDPHHIKYWRHGGGTDLDNLVPLCTRHHHSVHEGGWRLHLDPDTRHLTITTPDGTTLHSHINPPILIGGPGATSRSGP